MGGNATELLKQQMMISALVDGQDHASMLAGNASNFAARKAYLQQRSSYETLGKLAADTLPIMRAVLELLCYSLFLLLCPYWSYPWGIVSCKLGTNHCLVSYVASALCDFTSDYGLCHFREN